MAVAIAIVSLSLATAAEAISCGKQRWPVKTGTDGDASQVSLTTVVPTTISTLRALQAPESRPQDARVGPTETTVFAVTAFITHYKREPDSDYHLVIADAEGRTMVAEIPHPSCVFGSTPLSTGIARARAAFDAALRATTKFKEADPPIAVSITGVGFFDNPNHGKGAPANGIELHPVLDIVFNPASTTATSTGRQLLLDPGFESPASGVWVVSDGVLTNSTKRAAHVGKGYAWLGGHGKTRTETLRQELTLPASATSITLAYYLTVDTKEHSSTEQYDTLAVEIRTASGSRIATLGEYSNLDNEDDYRRRTFDLTQYRGQTVVLWFIAEEDQSLQTSFLLDDCLVESN